MGDKHSIMKQSRYAELIDFPMDRCLWGVLSASTLSVPAVMAPNDQMDITASISAIAFAACVLSLTGVVDLCGPEISGSKIYRSYAIAGEVDLKKKLD